MSTLPPVLVVDDSAPIREMIRTVLAPRGFRIVAAADGLEALERLRAAVEPHIVLLDVVMPRMGGIELCRAIEHNEALRAVGHHVILMSSSQRLFSPEIPQAARRLAKPFSRQQLVGAVEAELAPGTR